MLPMKKTCSTRVRLRRKAVPVPIREVSAMKDERAVRAEAEITAEVQAMGQAEVIEAVMVLMGIAEKTAATDLMSR